MISYIVGISCSVILASICALLLINGVDSIKEKHPDYKGEDFLNWGEDDVTKTAGRDIWDDEWNAHTEGEF